MPVKYKVFLSFPVATSSWSTSLATSLKRYGVTVFPSTGDVRAGEPFKDAVEGALKDSEVVVLVVDSSSSHSPWLAFEWGAAKSLGKPVISILAPGAKMEGVAGVFQRDEGVIRGSEPDETADQVVNILKASTSK